jgi:hypothetical protein
MKNVLVVFLGFCFLVTSSCAKNLFDELADKKDPKAVVFEAKKALNKRRYAEAIQILEELDPAYLAKRDVAFILASAYVGRCGLNFIRFLGNLQNDAGSGFFGMLMGAFPQAVVDDIDFCVTAEQIIQNVVDDPVDRTLDENFLMLFVSFAKIGVALNAVADTDDDGSVDVGFNHCSAASISNNNVAEVGTGFANALISLTYVGSLLGGDLSSLTQACDDLVAINPQLAVICTLTDKTQYTQNMLLALRAVIGSQSFGIGSCTNNQGEIQDCICPP